MSKKRARWARHDITEIAADIKPVDETVPADAVCEFCPCHVGFEVFERKVSAVLRHLRNGNRVVKAHALHVYDDASRMQLGEDLKLLLDPGEELIGEKRAHHLPSIVERLRASRNIRIRKSKRRYRLDARIRKSKMRF